jgi:hypothetical protein
MSKQKTEMVVAEQQAPQAMSWTAIRSLAEAITLAEIVVKSVAIPDVKNVGQAVLKILAGAEMGFGAFASLVDVHIIEGKPAIGAKLMAAAIKRSGVYDFKIRRLDAQACDLEFFRRGESLGNVSYSLKEAVEAGVATQRDGKTLKANWQRHPDDMLFARCVSKGFRRHCPDLCGGVVAYDPDELDGGAPQSAPTQPPPRPAPQAVDAEVIATRPPPSASENQVLRLKFLVRELGFTEQQVGMALKARSVTNFEALSSMRAGEMLEGLEERLKKKVDDDLLKVRIPEDDAGPRQTLQQALAEVDG